MIWFLLFLLIIPNIIYQYFKYSVKSIKLYPLRGIFIFLISFIGLILVTLQLLTDYRDQRLKGRDFYYRQYHSPLPREIAGECVAELINEHHNTCPSELTKENIKTILNKYNISYWSILRRYFLTFILLVILCTLPSLLLIATNKCQLKL